MTNPTKPEPQEPKRDPRDTLLVELAKYISKDEKFPHRMQSLQEAITALQLPASTATEPPAPVGDNSLLDAAVNQNDAMRQELVHIGNIVPDLAKRIVDAEQDLADDYADAEATGERPDLAEPEIELGLDFARTILAALASRPSSATEQEAVAYLYARKGFMPSACIAYPTYKDLESVVPLFAHPVPDAVTAQVGPGAWVPAEHLVAANERISTLRAACRSYCEAYDAGTGTVYVNDQIRTALSQTKEADHG